jgi:pyruvate, water dikinase
MIYALDDLNGNDTDEFGGKAANLARLISLGVPVPPGLVIPSSEFRKFLKHNHIDPNMSRYFNCSKEVVTSALEDIKKVIVAGMFPQALIEEIKDKCLAVGFHRLAVRSSGNMEDAKDFSFAGVFKSYLNVSLEEIEMKVKQVWASIFDYHVFDYCHNNQIAFDQIYIAVILQKMITPSVSGVCFTANPVTKDRREIVIECVFGLGELLVSGAITPDTYFLDKETLTVTMIFQNEQEYMLENTDSGIAEKNVPPDIIVQRKLTDGELIRIAEIAIKIENEMAANADVEFVVSEKQLFIVQFRPITTLN